MRLPEGTTVWALAAKNSHHAARSCSAVVGRVNTADISGNEVTGRGARGWKRANPGCGPCPFPWGNGDRGSALPRARPLRRVLRQLQPTGSDQVPWRCDRLLRRRRRVRDCRVVPSLGVGSRWFRRHPQQPPHPARKVVASLHDGPISQPRVRFRLGAAHRSLSAASARGRPLRQPEADGVLRPPSRRAARLVPSASAAPLMAGFVMAR